MSSFSFNGTRSKSKPADSGLIPESPNHKRYRDITTTVPKNSTFLKSAKLSEFTTQFKSKLATATENFNFQGKENDVFNQTNSTKNLNIQKHASKHYKNQDETERFLEEVGLEKYVSLFKDNEITIEDIPLLTREDLIDLKLPIGPRNRLMNIIKDKFESSKIQRQLVQTKNMGENRHNVREDTESYLDNHSQNMKTLNPKERPSSRQSMDSISTESIRSPISYDEVVQMLNNMREQQNIMLRAIQENQRVVAMLCQTDYLSSGNRNIHNRQSSTGYNGDIF